MFSKVTYCACILLNELGISMNKIFTKIGSKRYFLTNESSKRFPLAEIK